MENRKQNLKKRRGCIRVSKQLIEEFDIQFAKLFFGNFYPINTERVGFNDILYYGYSEHFEETIEGTSMQYEATIDTVKNKIKFSHI